MKNHKSRESKSVTKRIGLDGWENEANTNLDWKFHSEFPHPRNTWIGFWICTGGWMQHLHLDQHSHILALVRGSYVAAPASQLTCGDSLNKLWFQIFRNRSSLTEFSLCLNILPPTFSRLSSRRTTFPFS